jgi:hypothetical protein
MRRFPILKSRSVLSISAYRILSTAFSSQAFMKEELVTKKSKTPLLDAISTPADLRRLPEADLAQVANELRIETIDAVSVTGGHLGGE